MSHGRGLLAVVIESVWSSLLLTMLMVVLSSLSPITVSSPTHELWTEDDDNEAKDEDDDDGCTPSSSSSATVIVCDLMPFAASTDCVAVVVVVSPSIGVSSVTCKDSALLSQSMVERDKSTMVMLPVVAVPFALLLLLLLKST